MYARSTTFMARPETLDQGIEFIRSEVMPGLEAMGCIGVSVLCDRASGRLIATSSWQTEEEMRRTNEQVQSYRTRGAEIMGSDPEVTSWEIALMHREHQTRAGSVARCSWLTAPPSSLERGVDAFKLTVLPALEEIEGFCSASLFVDRAAGRAVSCSVFDDRAGLEASRPMVDRMRERIASEIGARVDDVVELDVVIAHLRVPETV